MSQLIRPRRLAVLMLSGASLVAAVGISGVLAPAASADRFINGCKIVDSPTPEQHTSCPRANLRDADLRGVGLRYAGLSEATLSRAMLIYANLSDANLSGANVTYADLRQANLSYTNLIRAYLTNADLSGAKLCHTTLPDGRVDDRDCARTSSTQRYLRRPRQPRLGFKYATRSLGPRWTARHAEPSSERSPTSPTQ